MHADRMQGSSELLDIITEVGRALTSSLDLDAILTTLMERVSRLLKPKAWSFLSVDPKTGELVFDLAVSGAGERLRGVRLPKGSGIAGWVAEQGEPLLVRDVREDPRFSPDVDREFGFVTRSIICIPVRGRSGVLGVIELVNSYDDGHFDDADLRILSTIADYAAVAIENARYVERINALVITDDLTGLYNARHFDEALEEEVARAQRYGTPLALLFLDLDHFKSVNDTHGHLAGSRLLAEVGQLIRRTIRKVDKAARYGGDEFVLILPNTGREGALVLASNLRRVLAEQVFRTPAGLPVRVTASFGVAALPEDAADKRGLIAAADAAMYRVKEGGRNGVLPALSGTP
ncbi:MAG TPA: sensor domain-containing diguanylate cyclase [Verrucomicrobiae bacterium]|nr:sensor domain-containing diguanylate cyclase [Verrucomicrobiae bacterium]